MRFFFGGISDHTQKQAPCPGVASKHKTESMVYVIMVVFFCLFVFVCRPFDLFFSFSFLVLLSLRKRGKKREAG